MTKRRIRTYITENTKGVMNLIQDMHAKNLKYILLNNTSATAWGLVLKEAWKQAYPSEEIPKFYRVDPKVLEGIPNSEKSKQAWKEYLEKRGMKETDKIIDFDEEYAGGRSANLVREAFENERGLYGAHHFKNMEYMYCDAGWMVRNNGKLVRPVDFTDLSKKQPGFQRYRISGGIDIDPTIKTEGTEGGKFRLSTKSTKSLREPPLEPLKFTGDLIHHPSAEYKEIYQEIKLFGREIGQQLHSDLERQKSLEEKLSGTTALVGILGSLFFIGSNLTGNVIANLSSNTTNITGIILFLVGVVGAFFHFKEKKK